MRWLALLTLCACAHAVPTPAPAGPPRPAIFGAEGERVEHFFARLLVDACTERATSEELIGAVLEGMARCPEPFGAACVHAACVWLSGPENCPSRLAVPMRAAR